MAVELTIGLWAGYRTRFVSTDRGGLRAERPVPSTQKHLKKAGHRETDVSTEQSQAQADSRLSGADAHPERPCGDQPAPGQGPQTPERLMPASAPARGERLLLQERLRRRADYLRCYRTGRRRHGALALVYFAPNQLGHPRLGITASRKVGKAVVRQRLKRRIREIYRRWKDRGTLPPLDLVVHLKTEAGTASFDILQTELLRLFGSLLPRRGAAA